MTTKIIKIHSIQLVLCVKATSDFCKFAFSGSCFHWYLLMFYRFLDWAPLHPKSSEYWKSVCFYWTNDRWILLCVEVYFIFDWFPLMFYRFWTGHPCTPNHQNDWKVLVLIEQTTYWFCECELEGRGWGEWMGGRGQSRPAQPSPTQPVWPPQIPDSSRIVPG